MPAAFDFRPVPLWSWNDRMEPARCVELMRELASAGYGGAYLHARLGMLIPYMSNAYQDAIAASVAAAAECGIHAHLYDEDRWPSGWAGGAVPRTSESYRVKALIQRRQNETVAAGHRLITSSGEFQYFVVTMPFGHPKFNGTCYTDLTNPEAMRCFIECAYEPLQQRLGESFGRAAPTIFTDEPALTYLYTWPERGLPWSDQLPPRFQEATGTELSSVLGALFDDGPASAEVRIHFYRLLAELFAESFMKQISRWCHQHGIIWTGHFMYEHSLPLHFSWSANCHASYRYFDWPGIDHLGRQVGEVVTAIGCRSAVHQLAKPRMMSELFGASGQNLSFADRKWIAEQQIVLGVNHLVPHLTSTTLLGPRKRDYPPTISPHQPWWPLNRVVEEHLTRLCELFGQGEAETDLLVIHPQESVFALSQGPVPVGNADTWIGRFFHAAGDVRLRRMDDQWKKLCHHLLDAGYVFDFGDEAVLAECGSVVHGAGSLLRVGAATYRAVLIPPLVTIRPSTVKLLADFVEAGGTLVQFGSPPQMLDGRNDEASHRLLNSLSRSVAAQCAAYDELMEFLKKAVPPVLQIDSSDTPHGRVWRYTKRRNDCRLTLVVNLDRIRSRQITLSWSQPPNSAVHAWPTHSAASERVTLSVGKLSLSLPPGSSHVIVEGDRPALVPPSIGPVPRTSFVSGHSLPWKVTRLDPNALVVDEAEFHTGDGNWQGPYPVLAIKEWLDERRHTGSVVVRFTIATDFPDGMKEPLQLIIEGVERLGTKVRINGREIDTSDVGRRHWLDLNWHPIVVPPALIGRQVQVELAIASFQFGDPATPQADRRLGTELESLLVLGDFAVDGAAAVGPQGWEGQIEYHTSTPLSDWLPPQRLQYLARPFVLRQSRQLSLGDVTAQGLPFYAGRIRYEADVSNVNSASSQTVLRLKALAASAAMVEVNERVVGTLAWPPYELDITPFLTEKYNRLTITFYSSLRNLLGPHHHPDGEPVYVNPGSFRPEGCPTWLEALRANRPIPGWTDHYALVEFGLSGPK